MKQLFISIGILVAAIAFFLLEAPSLPAQKANGQQAKPAAPLIKRVHLDSTSKAPKSDSLHFKI